jgi:hypothetical protein
MYVAVQIQMSQDSFSGICATVFVVWRRNQMTHWWDASNIYGPSKSFAYSLRDGVTRLLTGCLCSRY